MAGIKQATVSTAAMAVVFAVEIAVFGSIGWQAIGLTVVVLAALTPYARNRA